MNVISLYDASGNMLRPWATAGYSCYAFDILNQGNIEQVGLGSITYIKADLLEPSVHSLIKELKPVFLFGFPPCTDLAVSGSRHFLAKKKANPNYLSEAMALVLLIPALGKELNCPWGFENPVSRVSTLYRKPNWIFDPYEFGGYLPEDDKHPRWPQYIKARDAYPKKTCIWAGGGFFFPKKKPVWVRPGYSNLHYYLGGKSAKTKSIRSETPRGFAQAVFEINHEKIQVKLKEKVE